MIYNYTTQDRKIRDHRCAPSKEFIHGSCIPLTSLIEMAKAYNKKYNDNITIKNQDDVDDPEKYKRYLMKNFTEKISSKSQIDWLYDPSMELLDKKILNDLKTNTFRKPGPSSGHTWLNNFNIQDALEQYYAKYPTFIFLGSFPIDFQEINYLNINDVDYLDLYNKGKHHIGLIFNLDKHNQSGSHWVCLFIDLKKNRIYFFDSQGKKPHQNIVSYMTRIVYFLHYELHIPLERINIRYNNIKHQRGGSECGVYCLSFILRSLRGDKFDQIINNPISDDAINKCRRFYFT